MDVIKVKTNQCERYQKLHDEADVKVKVDADYDSPGINICKQCAKYQKLHEEAGEGIRKRSRASSIVSAQVIGFIVLVILNLYILYDHHRTTKHMERNVKICMEHSERMRTYLSQENSLGGEIDLIKAFDNVDWIPQGQEESVFSKDKAVITSRLENENAIESRARANTKSDDNANAVLSNNDINIIHNRQKRNIIPGRGRERLNSHTRKARGSQVESEGFQIEAAHLHPKTYMNETEKVRQGHTVIVDCGSLVPHGITVTCEKSNFWEFDENTKSNDIVTEANGVLIIKKTGNYYVYSQVSHHDILGTWSYGIMRKHNEEEHTVAQCLGMEPSLLSQQTLPQVPVVFQCNTGRVVRLHKGDQLYIKNMYYDHQNRVVKIDRHLTFWGLLRISK